MTPLDEANEFTDNWWRYFRVSKRPSRAMSLEGRYVPERKDMDYEEEPPPPASMPLDMKKAIAMELIWIDLPSPYKDCLKYETFHKWALKDRHFKTTCRWCKVRPSDFDKYVKEAKLMSINKYYRREG